MANQTNFDSGVIMTRTPLRVSFAGGGTDLADFYERDFGAVFSSAINKYIYVTVKRHGSVFNEAIRLNYSRSETVNRVDEVENDIARECMRFLEITPPIYISTVADLPASTGLGGSSSFTVGLLNALHAFRGERVAAGQLAEEACHIEINVLKQPIGKQDQYAAAFGGLNFFSFKPGGAVTVEPQRLNNGSLKSLFDHIVMFWTGHQRDSSSVLSEQKANTALKLNSLLQMREHAIRLQSLSSNGGFDACKFGRILDESWQLKRDLSSKITTSEIDDWYNRAMAAGAEGGKLCGAGGGGFLLFLVKPERQPAVCEALRRLTEVPVAPEVHGSQVCSPFVQ
ncbi:MAG TPA: GHMP kinase [Candidatus Binatia bacterium]